MIKMLRWIREYERRVKIDLKDETMGWM